MKLNEISNNEGANRRRLRVGRGIGSGKGKTCGRGVKGQKSRSGVAVDGFEGGQMPIHMRLPKRGFNKPNQLSFAEVNIGRVQKAIDEGKLDSGATVTEEALLKSGVIRRVKDGVRLLGKGELKAKAKFEVTGASKGAIEAVKNAGGDVAILPPKRNPQLGPKERKLAKSA